MTDHPLLTLPETPESAVSIRAKALLFHDPRSVELLEHIERLARSEATVLVIGETGTGKELVARHIHRVSGRRGPFVAVNCGAFSESLIDAELFGHEAGAFTGASGARAGWFEAAQGGTLFLDEIGDLSLGLQVKLLRVLQERQVVRLGSRKPLQLDVRLVAATNIDLQQAVEAQRFRADLFYRLSVAPVDLPPLRNRQGDLLPLARHFIGVYSERLRLPQPAHLTTDAEQALLLYPWPGNIRELENVIHFALIICRDGLITPQQLKLVAGPPVPYPGQPGASAEPSPRPQPSTAPLPVSAAPAVPAALVQADAATAAERLAPLFDQLLVEAPRRLFHTAEETLVRRAFLQCRENQVQTARLLGLTRNSLRTLLKRYGLINDGAVGEPGDGDDAGDSPALAAAALQAQPLAQSAA